MSTTIVTREPVQRETKPRPFMTSKAAAELLSCSSRKITDMCRKGEIKAVRVGSDWRINTRAFLEQFGF